MSWSYQNHGRIVTASGGGVSTETAYLNVSGNPDSIKTVMAGRTYWRRYGYTQAGNVDTVDVSGAAITFLGRKYVYHAGHGALTNIRLSGANTTLGVNGNLQVISRLFSGLDVESRQYNTLHRVMQIASTEPYKLWTQRDVGFDVANRISEQLFGGGDTGEIYGYDGLGRLFYRWSGHYADTLPPWCYDPDNGVACYPKTTWVTTSADSFTYDPAGNRTDRGGSYLTGNRVTQFDGCSYTTDADGNVTSRTGASCTRGAGSFTWHAEGLLATVAFGGSTVTLKYDAAGRLVRKDVSGVPQSHFLWDGGNLLAELDGNGTVKRAEYSYYPGVDRLHALILGSAIYYAHVDAIGNVIALTDVGKNLKRTYNFDMWGAQAGGTDYLPFNGYDRARWKGALLLIPELNLYYMRNRWYEGGTGRFLSEDPLGLAGGLNPYIYAGNDPINLSDPSGLIICDGWCGTPGIGGGGPAFGTPSFAGNAAPTMGELLAAVSAAWAAGYEGVVYTSQDGLVTAQWACPACVRAIEALTRLGARITGPLQRAIHKAHQLAQGRDITWSRLGENVRAVWRVPGGDPAGAYADWTRIIDAEGRNVWLWKHSYVGGQYQGTTWYVMDYIRINAGP